MQTIEGDLLTGDDRDRLRCFSQRKRQPGGGACFPGSVGMAAFSGGTQYLPSYAGGLQLQLPVSPAGRQRVQSPHTLGASGGDQAAAAEQALQALRHIKSALEGGSLFVTHQRGVVRQGNIGLLGKYI